MSDKALTSQGMQGDMRGVAVELADLLWNLGRTLFDPYRPERHYMRGPGPKWHARHRPPRTIRQPAY